MVRFARALERAQTPLRRELAAAFVVGGVALALDGVSQAVIPPAVPWGVLARTLAMTVFLWSILDPRLRRACVARWEGCRLTDAAQTDPLLPNWHWFAGIVCTVLASYPDWRIRAAGLAGITVVMRSPFYAAFLWAGHIIWPHQRHDQMFACLVWPAVADGLFRWSRASKPSSPEPANENLAGDLLALIERVGPMDRRWLERSAGLDSPERVAACLEQIRARGWLTERGPGLYQVATDGAQTRGRDTPPA